MGRYDVLSDWLAGHAHIDLLTMSFTDVEGLIGAALPASARKHRAWWANDETHVQAKAWMSAGWIVDVVQPWAEQVRFRPVDGAIPLPTLQRRTSIAGGLGDD